MSREDVHGPPLQPERDRVILLAEDEILIRMASAEWLRDAGYTVIEAASGTEALDLLGNGVPVDLLVTDISMPGGPDGLELAERVRGSFPHMAIILASARLPDESPADRMLPKPYGVPELLSLVKELIEARWTATNNPKAS